MTKYDNKHIFNNKYIGFHTSKDYLDNYLCPLQFFVGAPHNYQSTQFLNKSYKNRQIFVHSKYVGNIAKHKSTVTIRNIKKELLYLQNMEISNSGTVVHLSSYYDETPEKSLIYVSSVLNKFCKELNSILNKKYYNYIIFETTNDINHLGSKIEHFKILYDNLDYNAKKRIRFCIDTSHIFVTFYNIDTNKGIIDYIAKFDLLIGLDKVLLIHLNDSCGKPLSSYKPHEEIGKGNIFKNYEDDINPLKIIKIYALSYNIPCILERRYVLPDSSTINEMKIYLDTELHDLDTNTLFAMINKYKILYILNKFAEIYNILDDVKYKAYKNAINTIQNNSIIKFNYIYKNNKYTLNESEEKIINKYKNLQYIGPSISSVIYELLSTNKVEKLNNLENSETLKYIKELTSILFIGKTKAEKLIELNIKNVDDLLSNKEIIVNQNILTENKLKIIEYIKDIEPISKSFIDEIKQDIKLNKNYEWHILGSYARGLEYSKDIDILIIDFDIDILLNSITKICKLIYPFRKGNDIFSGVFLRNNKKFILEINKVNNNQKYTAIMHYTGSKNFNIIMRNIAKTQDMKLSQYSLSINNKPVDLNSEEEIFNILKTKYIPKNKRNL
ncbi:DNA polymerase-beta/AP pol [Adoxophyes honmai entomopoxvirus 'L']|uniref:Probable AP endonuclease n=1 Tax=Adoxophyes honmai entomopoxvirus 'L' TaxID=1293540 RepID=A0A916KP45_9POXV|nr:DNA polymerase-beta/AP pol [Adoxophyes honmai entomopoxvirus 'L']CCU55461.1 DNA polymerase-beta/AP pol [Adoxophyes honmai entomopoxvirus 'L']